MSNIKTYPIQLPDGTETTVDIDLSLPPSARLKQFCAPVENWYADRIKAARFTISCIKANLDAACGRNRFLHDVDLYQAAYQRDLEEGRHICR